MNRAFSVVTPRTEDASPIEAPLRKVFGRFMRTSRISLGSDMATNRVPKRKSSKFGPTVLKSSPKFSTSFDGSAKTDKFPIKGIPGTLRNSLVSFRRDRFVKFKVIAKAINTDAVDTTIVGNVTSNDPMVSENEYTLRVVLTNPAETASQYRQPISF
jgi:hypothetical protein